MSRELVPLRTDDLSGFARSLARELGETAPSHLSLLNMLARSAGFRNYQHLRAESHATERLEAPPAADPEIDHRRIERAVNHFDEVGRLSRWPSRNAMQKLVVWAFWADLPRGESLSEREVNDRFDAHHTFRDPATLRRMLVGLGRVEREADGSAYRRVEQPLPAEAAELIRHVRARRSSRAAAEPIAPTS